MITMLSSLKVPALVFLLAFIIFLAFLAAFYAGWIGQISSGAPDKKLFPVKAKSCIQFEIMTDDSLSIDLRSYARFPLYSNDKSFKIAGDTTLYISMTTNNPNHAEIRLENNKFRVFVYPGDTSTIELSKIGDSLLWRASHNSKYNQIIDYYFNKDKALEYQDQWQVLSPYIYPKYSYLEFNNKADLLYHCEMQFFDSCCYQIPFPEWFLNYERNDILYFNANAKLSKIYRHYKYYEDSTAYNAGNLDFLDSIPINNNDAILSPCYFEFLISYNIHIGHEELHRVDHTDHVFKIIEIFEDSLNNRLDKIISDKYFIKLTSEAFLSLPSSYVRYNLDSNDLYPAVDSILLYARHRNLEPDYIDYLKHYYDKLKESARKLALLTKGDKAPGFYLKGEQGDFYSLKDYRGKIVMLNFWAEYCLSCLNTVPQKNEIVKLFSKNDFVMINIFLTNKEDVWKKLIKEKGMKGTNLICQEKWAKILMDGYNIHAIPAYTLIDKNGNIIQNGIDGLEKVKTIISKYIM